MEAYMGTYLIHEDNLDRFDKKIQTIKNKCIKNDLSFSYEILGEVFKDITDEDGRVHTSKFYEVSVSGSFRYEGWRFAAVIEHHGDDGNIIRAYDTELEIPERFRTCGPTCEHCNRIRSRKDTYVVYNEEAQEFKQVGKQCLQDYTNGLNAENVASYISLFDAAINGQAPSGSHYKSYLNVDEVLRFSAECIKHFGYEKRSDYDEYYNPRKRTTRGRVSDYMCIRSGGTVLKMNDVIHEMEQVNFNENSEFAVNRAKEVVEWLKSEEGDNGYISNLKVATASEYVESRDFGLLVSAPFAYINHLEYVDRVAKQEAEQAKQAKIEKLSEFVGEIKEKLTINVHDLKCVTTLNSQFGTTFLYRWTDENNNIFVWYASSPILDDEDLVIEIKGTVKDHSEYRGAKQTVMTRCKVTGLAKAEPKQIETAPNFLDTIKFPWEEE